LTEEAPFEVDFDNADYWFQSLEDELNEIRLPDPNSQLELEAQTDLTLNNFFDYSPDAELDLFTDNQEFDGFDDIELVRNEK
jgi:hypothetical protein